MRIGVTPSAAAVVAAHFLLAVSHLSSVASLPPSGSEFSFHHVNAAVNSVPLCPPSTPRLHAEEEEEEEEGEGGSAEEASGIFRTLHRLRLR